ncbi:hypothetical protein Tco_0030976 [Tanacetum coccineum]
MTGERILKDHWREEFRDEEDDLEENLKDLEEYGEDKANAMMETIHDKLKDEWFNGTSEDEDDLEGIMDYLEPRSYDGFIDLDDEAYNKRKCGLLGITYKDPSPILIEKVKVTRYTIGPDEIYMKVKVLGVDELPRTRDNVATIRARLMEKIANEGNGQTKTICKGGFQPERLARVWVWKSVRYDVSKGLDTAYWSFLELGPRLISSRIFTYYIMNMAYRSSLDTTY